MKHFFICLIPILVLPSSLLIYDFKNKDDLDGWYVVNDGVMGGLSEGSLSITQEGHALFEGFVSLENYGGFTSIRFDFEIADVSDFSKVVLKIRGDGKKYQFRLRENREDWHSYITYFKTAKKWETIEIPLKEFYPSFRGRELDMPNYSGKNLSGISILIANKKEEDFRLLIDEIRLK